MSDLIGVDGGKFENQGIGTLKAIRRGWVGIVDETEFCVDVGPVRTADNPRYGMFSGCRERNKKRRCIGTDQKMQDEWKRRKKLDASCGSKQRDRGCTAKRHGLEDGWIDRLSPGEA